MSLWYILSERVRKDDVTVILYAFLIRQENKMITLYGTNFKVAVWLYVRAHYVTV